MAGHSTRPYMVTGGAGFIGSHVVDRLRNDGHSVIVVDDLSTGQSSYVPQDVQFHQVDISTADIERIIHASCPGVIIHCAARVSVPASMNDPVGDLEVNVLGTARIVRASLRAGVGRIVFLSSGGAIYGETTEPATESSPAQPENFYGLHKLAAEYHVTLSGLSHSILRPSNVYGPRQRDDQEGGVVSIFLRRALASQPVDITGDGNQSRDFVHVRDLVDAVRTTMSMRESGVWNVSTGHSTGISALASLVAEVTGVQIEQRRIDARPGDVYNSCLDSTRLRRETSWTPQVSLREGLANLNQYIRQRDPTGVLE